MSITLYEPGTCRPDHKSFSPWSLLVRCALHSKSLPFHTTLIPISTLQSFAPSIGAQPTLTNADGSPKYSFPIIKDNGEVVSDSLEILKYLEATYPDSGPSLFPLEGAVDSKDIVHLVAHTLGHGSPIYNTLLAPEWKRHMPVPEYPFWEAQLRLKGGGLLGRSVDPDTWLAPPPGSSEFQDVIRETRVGVGKILERLGGRTWFGLGGEEEPTYPDFALLAHLEMVYLWRPDVYDCLFVSGEAEGDVARGYHKRGERLLVLVEA